MKSAFDEQSYVIGIYGSEFISRVKELNMCTSNCHFILFMLGAVHQYYESRIRIYNQQGKKKLKETRYQQDAEVFRRRYIS